MSRFFKSGDSESEVESDNEEEKEETYELKGSPVDFLSMRDKHTDVTFEVGPASKAGLDTEPLTPKTFEAHRLILSRHSDVLEKMLYGEFSEGKDPKPVVLHHDSCVFGYLLDWMYGEKIEPTLDELLKLYKLTDKYDVKELKRACQEKLSTEMDVENVYQIYCGVKAFDEKLVDECHSKMWYNLVQVVRDNDIDQKSFFELILILKEECLSTATIWNAMKVWKEKADEIDDKLWKNMTGILNITQFSFHDLLTVQTLLDIFDPQVVMKILAEQYAKIPAIGSKVTLEGVKDVTVEKVTFERNMISINGKYYEHNGARQNFFVCNNKDE
jgi:hypothetical protein